MAQVTLDKALCRHCRKCISSCPYGCIKFFDDYPVISQECRLCGACIQACPFKALKIESDAKAKEDLTKYRGVMVFAEQRDGIIIEAAYELVGKARRMADELGEEAYAVLLGQCGKDEAQKLIAYGADKVYHFDDRRLTDYRDDPYAQVLCHIVKERKPSILLVAATSIGRILAPRVSMKMWTGLTADCTKLDIDSKTRLLLQTRPAFGGNIMATITCQNSRPQMATVRPKVMDKPGKDLSRRGEIVKMKAPAALLDRVRIVKRVVEKGGADIAEADVIVVGGRGLERKQGFDMLKEFAGLIGGVVGSTRPPVEEGWISYSHQIGLSGKTVRPKVYIACGVSGTVQHTAGMETSDYIIAINKDPEAPIFRIADYGIVADLYSIVPEVIEGLKKAAKVK